MYLIGSSYITSVINDFYRISNDIDYIVESIDNTLPKLLDNKRIEYHINPVLFNYITKFGNSLEVQYTLKLSHMFYDINWSKHLSDIKWYQSKQIKYIPELYKDLINYWKTIHIHRKQPDFTKLNIEFFYDKVNRKISHDDLHELVKYYDNPLFNKVKLNLEYAEINEELFYKLNQQDQIKLILEECYVLCIERNKLIDIRYNTKLMTYNTLKIMIQRLLPDWLSLYTILNFTEIHNQSIHIKQLIKTINYENN